MVKKQTSRAKKKGVIVETLAQAKKFFNSGKIKIPCQVIPAYVLHKDRKNFVREKGEFDMVVRRALDKSPIGQALIVKLEK